MKLYKYLTTLAGVGLLAFTSCSEDLDINSGVNSNGDLITLNLDVPEFTVQEIGTRAGDNPTLTSVMVYPFTDANNYGTPKAAILAGNKITFEKTDGIHHYEFVANYTANSGAPKSVFTSDASADYLWGTWNNSSTEVLMYRHNAAVEVNNTAAGFTLTGFDVFGTANEGSLAPADGIAVSPTIKEGEVYTHNLTDGKPAFDNFDNSQKAIFETINDKDNPHGKIIIKGTYDGKEGYYPVIFAKRSEGDYNSEDPGKYTYERINILRNRKYTVTIEYVRAAGWSSAEEAYNAEPDNRLTVLITEENGYISDIVACRDYALGVTASEITVPGADTGYTLNVVHNYKNGFVKPDVTKNQDWVSVSVPEPESANVNTAISAGNSGGNGRTFAVDLNFTSNPSDQSPREALITVKVGDLVRTVKLIQAPSDFLRDPHRAVSLRIDNKVVTSDYFTWIDQTNQTSFCYGVRPEDNQGVIRTKGLIFPPVPIAYANGPSQYYKYLVPKLTGDTGATVTGVGGYNVEEEDGYWVLTQTDYTNEQGISDTNVLTITTSSGSINYVIYTTGFFHKLTNDMLSDLSNNDGSVNAGWYYYEFVQKGDIYVADRNIGATTNAPYISSYIGYTSNTGAKGAYFKIAKQRVAAKTGVPANIDFWNQRYISDKTILSGLGLQKSDASFIDAVIHIPTVGDLAALGFTLSHPSGVTGNASNVVAVTDLTKGLVKDARIYIPHTGYYEGSDLKMGTRANIWTSTIYSEPQGFHPNYRDYPNKNFGFWYYYLDAQPRSGYTSAINQIRVNDATTNDFSDANVTRYMPIRLVYGTPNTGK